MLINIQDSAYKDLKKIDKKEAIKILEQLIQSAQIVKRNKDLEQIIHMLRVYTKKQLGFMCESWVINLKMYIKTIIKEISQK